MNVSVEINLDHIPTFPKYIEQTPPDLVKVTSEFCLIVILLMSISIITRVAQYEANIYTAQL